MSKAYRFEIQGLINVVIEDDSNNPMNKIQARRFVVENLREYIDSADLSDFCISDGVDVK